MTQEQNHTAAHYLRDLGSLIRELAVRAKQESDDGQGSDASQFLLGRLGALHEVTSLMQQQALAFGIALEELALDGIDPDRDLL